MSAPAATPRRAAIVTGSTSGIGLGIATALARAGYDVLINGSRGSEEGAELSERLADEFGVNAGYKQADLTKPADIESLAETARGLFGRIDVVVNNAGVQHVAPIEDFPPEKWNLILALNLSAAFHLIRLSLPDMRARGFGRIINVASAHALVASPMKSAYVAAKHGLLGLTKAVALETAAAGITCNAICPGYVRTKLVEEQIPVTARARGISAEAVVRDIMLKPQATGRFIEIGEVAALAVFLCSDAAASITGAALPVDGGWTAH